MADFARALARYLRAVASECRIGPEFCVVDSEEPASVYIALAERLARYPGRDLALVWDERTGWALAIETNSGEDLLVVAGLGGDSVVPPPSSVRRVVDYLIDRGGWVGRRRPPLHRTAGHHDELADQMIAAMRRTDHDQPA